MSGMTYRPVANVEGTVLMTTFGSRRSGKVAVQSVQNPCVRWVSNTSNRREILLRLKDGVAKGYLSIRQIAWLTGIHRDVI